MKKNKKLTAVLSAVGVLSTGVGPHVGACLYPEDNEHVYHEMSIDFTKKQKTQNYETFSISSRRSEKMMEKK